MEKTSMVWRLLWLLRTIEESPGGISARRQKHVMMGRSGPVDYSKAGPVFDLIDSATKEHTVLSY